MRRSFIAGMLSGLPLLAQAVETPAPAVSTAGSLLQVFIGLVAVLLLIVATAWAARRMGVSAGGSSNLLQIISSTSVGARERIVVVEVGESWLVVGVTPSSINALTTLPRGEHPAPGSSPANSNFAARLKHLIEKSPSGDKRREK